MSKKEEIKDEIKEEAVEKVATGIGVAFSKALGKIPVIRSFQETMIKLGGKNTSAEIRKKKPHGPHKH